MDVLQAIGNTSLVRLRKVVPPGSAEVWAKLEWERGEKSRPARADPDRSVRAAAVW